MKKFFLKANLTFTAGSAYGIPGPLIGGSIAISGESWPKLNYLLSQFAHYSGDTPLQVIPANQTDSKWLETLLGACLVALQLVKVPAGSTDNIRVQCTSVSDEEKCFSINLRAWNTVAFKLTLEWLLGAYREEDVLLDLNTLRKLLKAHALGGTNSFPFFMAARRLGYETWPLPMGTWAFGTGIKQRWFKSSFSDQTSQIATAMARDKIATASILRNLGFPAPQHVLVHSRDDAVKAAANLGYPVVVKPADLDQGKGVAADLKNADVVLKSYDTASALSNNILVEKHFKGEDYRITVVEGEVVKVVHRRPGGVVGDGHHTVAELLQLANEDPLLQRRSHERDTAMLTLDNDALSLLQEQGLEAISVVPEQVFVRLRRKANISTGGMGVRVPLESVHHDNKMLAIRASSALNLDMSGIDLLIPDIQRSWLEIGALICEINAQPQIGASTSPEIYDEILVKLVGIDPHIPSWLVIAPDSVSDVELHSSMGDWWSGPGTGFTSKGMLYLAGERFAMIHSQAHAASRALLANRSIERALMRLSVADILKFGLPCHLISGVILWDKENGSLDDSSAIAECLQMIKPHCQRWMRIGGTSSSPWALVAAQEGIRLEPLSAPY